MLAKKVQRRERIQKGIRKKIGGTAERPRMSVYRSNKEIYVQMINDVIGVTLSSASSLEPEMASVKGSKVEIAKAVGQLAAKRAKDAGIDKVVFDRGGYLFHGRVKAVADGAREEGLSF